MKLDQLVLIRRVDNARRQSATRELDAFDLSHEAVFEDNDHLALRAAKETTKSPDRQLNDRSFPKSLT